MELTSLFQLFDAEANRKIKKEPPVALEVEQQQKEKLQLLFVGVDADDDADLVSAGGDVVTELWGFWVSVDSAYITPQVCLTC